jgi:hypothetical protein
MVHNYANAPLWSQVALFAESVNQRTDIAVASNRRGRGISLLAQGRIELGPLLALEEQKNGKTCAN